MDFGYCSHDAGQKCPNCSQTYYLIPGQSTPSPSVLQLRRIKLWLGRVPETDKELEEIQGLRQLLDQMMLKLEM